MGALSLGANSTYVTPLGVIKYRVSRARLRSFLPRGDAGAGAAQSGGERNDSASVLARDRDARSRPGGVSADGESVSAQMVSLLTRVLDRQVE
jgi:hypothetical protein